MTKKSFITLFTFLLLATSILAEMQFEVAEANPIPWNTKPNLDQPAVFMESPQNNTVYKDSNLFLIFNVTKPASWKIHGPIQYVGQITSVIKVYKDGFDISNHSNLVYDRKGSFFYSDRLNNLTSGLHILNITVLSYTYYTGPPYNNTHIRSSIASSDGPIYQYPVITSKLTYFTAGGAPLPYQTPMPTISIPEFPATLVTTFLLMMALAVAVVCRRRDWFL
jgi:hypothetical protein